MIGIVWTSVMSSVEWNKKEELVTEQAIKHLKVSSEVSAPMAVRWMLLPECSGTLLKNDSSSYVLKWLVAG